MWPFSKTTVEPSPTSQNLLLELAERVQLLELRVRANDVEMEDFTAKVSAAAKRAYKRDADAEKVSTRANPSSPSQSRLERKRELRLRAQGEA